MRIWDTLGSDEGPFDDLLVRLFDDPATGIWFLLGGLLVAVLVGAGHALAPGHGKALIGAYLAGTRGRPRDAVALGVLVAAMHSASVLVLAFAVGAASQAPLGPRFDAVVTLVAAVAVVLVGARLAWQRLRARTPVVAASTTGGGHHAHAPGRDHHPGHHHHDLPEGVAPLSRAGILALATTGGLLPSPVAFLVLMTALAVGRPGYGVALVAAFSVGLAITLTGLGLAILWGRDRIHAHAERHHVVGWVARNLPVAGAMVLVLGGALLAVSALRTL